MLYIYYSLLLIELLNKLLTITITYKNILILFINRYDDLYQITLPPVTGTAFRHIGIMSPIVTNRGFTCEDGPNIPD